MAEAYTSSASDQQQSLGIVNRVKETATARLTSQRDRGLDALGSVAEAVRTTTQKLRDERHDTIARYVDRAADQVEEWSQRLREKDVEELMTDIQRLARRRPAVFIGSAFALGLLGARFLKSSRPEGEFDERSESRRAVSASHVAIADAGDVAQSTGGTGTPTRSRTGRATSPTERS
jgi:hypothetical protein